MGSSAPLVRPVAPSPAEVSVPRPAPVADVSLVERAVSGEPWAQEALYRTYVHEVAGVATRVLGRSADAEDVVQEAFLVAFERLGSLRDPASFGGWLRTITINLARGRLRRRKLWRMVGLDDGEDDACLAALAAPGLGPEGRAMLSELDTVLATLSVEERIAWILRFVEGWSLGDVARSLGISLATAKRRLRAAQDGVHARTGFVQSEEEA